MMANDKLMQEVAEDLAKEFLADIPTDEELEQMGLPAGMYKRVAARFGIETLRE